MSSSTTRPFTGRRMAGVLVAFFGVVIAVNFTMARYASATFGGIVVQNSYVASQEFNGWLDQAAKQRELGWDAVTTWRPDGRLVVEVRGAPPQIAVSAVARHPLGRLPDRPLAFEPIDAPAGSAQRYLSRESLPDGRWTLRLVLSGKAGEWRREETVQ